MKETKFGLYSDEELRGFATYKINPEGFVELARSEEFSGKPQKHGSLLLEAHTIVHSKRAKEYGSFEENVEMATCLFNILRRKDGQQFMTHIDGAWFLVCLKLARESRRHKRDNLLDTAGYLELIDELIEKRLRKSDEQTT